MMARRIGSALLWLALPRLDRQVFPAAQLTLRALAFGLLADQLLTARVLTAWMVESGAPWPAAGLFGGLGSIAIGLVVALFNVAIAAEVRGY